MSRKSRQTKPPTFEDTVSEQFRYISATGFFGGLTPMDGRIVFFLDRPVLETASNPPGAPQLKKIVREVQVEVILPKMAYKQLCAYMQAQINRYESQWGEIPVKPKDGAASPAPSGLFT